MQSCSVKQQQPLLLLLLLLLACQQASPQRQRLLDLLQHHELAKQHLGSAPLQALTPQAAASQVAASP